VTNIATPSIAISVGAKFHAFFLARELERHGQLATIITGFPLLALKTERQWVNPKKIRSLGWPFLFIWGLQKFGINLPDSGYWQTIVFDQLVSRTLPRCDILLSWSGYSLRTAQQAQKRGIAVVIKRGSSHIEVQEELLLAEYDLWHYKGTAVDPRMLKRELAEYALADKITVPSTFAQKTFIQKGFTAEQVWVTPDGVDTNFFQPAASPTEQPFRIIFAGGISLRKGIQYLLASLKQIGPSLPIELVLAGGFSDGGQESLKNYSGPYSYRGFASQTELRTLYQESSVLVLPSIEEGFGVVIAEAMACGVPVITTPNTGGPDLIRDGVDGFIVPIRDVEALTDQILTLYKQPDLRHQMGLAARERIKEFSWARQAEIYMTLFNEILKTRER